MPSNRRRRSEIQKPFYSDTNKITSRLRQAGCWVYSGGGYNFTGLPNCCRCCSCCFHLISGREELNQRAKNNPASDVCLLVGQLVKERATGPDQLAKEETSNQPRATTTFISSLIQLPLIHFIVSFLCVSAKKKKNWTEIRNPVL